MNLKNIRRITIPVAAVAAVSACYIILTHQSAAQKAAETEAFKNHLVTVSNMWGQSGVTHTICKFKTQRLLRRENTAVDPAHLRSDYLCAADYTFIAISCNNDTKSCEYNELRTQGLRTKVADFVAKQALELK